jgi:hypothetical protein
MISGQEKWPASTFSVIVETNSSPPVIQIHGLVLKKVVHAYLAIPMGRPVKIVQTCLSNLG